MTFIQNAGKAPLDLDESISSMENKRRILYRDQEGLHFNARVFHRVGMRLVRSDGQSNIFLIFWWNRILRERVEKVAGMFITSSENGSAKRTPVVNIQDSSEWDRGIPRV